MFKEALSLFCFAVIVVDVEFQKTLPLIPFDVIVVATLFLGSI